MIRLSVLITLALLSGSAFAYLDEKNLELLASEQCKPHEEDSKYLEHLQLSYTLEFCSNLYKLREGDYRRGWQLHTWAKTLVNQLPCSCSLHTHADNLAYGVYLEVVEVLNTDTPIPDTVEKFCKEVEIDFKALAKEKGAE